MHLGDRISLPSFLAGAACAIALASVPAIAAVTTEDQQPPGFDGTSPALTVQPAKFVIGRSIDAAPATGDCGDQTYNYYVPMMLTWDANDSTSGVRSYDVGVADNDAGPMLVRRGTSDDSFTYNTLNYDNDCGGGFHNSYWWVVARDHRGSTALSPLVSNHVDVWDQHGVDRTATVPDLPVARTGAWSTSRCVCHNNGTTTYATARGASITYTVDVDRAGRTVAVVAPMSSNRGVMNISLDGAGVTAVSTYAATTQNRVIVWQKPLGAGRHTLRIVNAGTPGHGRIDVDTIMLGPAWYNESLTQYDIRVAGQE